MIKKHTQILLKNISNTKVNLELCEYEEKAGYFVRMYYLDKYKDIEFSYYEFVNLSSDDFLNKIYTTPEYRLIDWNIQLKEVINGS